MELTRRHALIVTAAIIGLLAFAGLMNIGLLWGGSSISAADDTVTCRDRATEMTAAERRDAAAERLAHARDKADGGKGLPADSLVDKYVQAIDAECRKGGKQAVDDVAVSVYLKQRATFRP